MRNPGPRNKPGGMPDLARLRESKGISLRQIADSTKISLRFLEAIERGDFAQLPGGIYDRSYIRQYARAIDVEESRLLALYELSTGSAR